MRTCIKLAARESRLSEGNPMMDVGTEDRKLLLKSMSWIEVTSVRVKMQIKQREAGDGISWELSLR